MSRFAERYGPWAVVVGASGGIGAAVADEAARRGVNVLAVARRREVLERRAETMRAAHDVEVRTLCMDMARADAVEAVTDACQDLEVGTLVFNAAAEPRGRFVDTPVQDLVDNIAVNCTAPTLLSHHFGRAMASRRRGGIVLVTSMGALQGGAVFSAYFAAKAYEWILAEGLWSELADVGVDVVAYMVGATRTESYVGQKDGSSDTTAGRPDPTLDLLAAAGQGDAFDASLLRLQHPSDPDEVGRHLLDVLATGPTCFSHPADEATAAAVLRLGRREAVARMSRLTSGIRA